jgi:hypothetical protein
MSCTVLYAKSGNPRDTEYNVFQKTVAEKREQGYDLRVPILDTLKTPTKGVTKTVAQASGKFLLIGALPALVSAYLSYQTAKVEAQVKIAELQTKVAMRADVGYETLVKKIDEIESRLAGLEERPAHAEIRTPTSTTRTTRPSSSRSRAGGSAGGSSSISLSRALADSPPPPTPAPAPTPSETLPRTLDDAVQAVQTAK